jgi:hypothetical protein
MWVALLPLGPLLCTCLKATALLTLSHGTHLLHWASLLCRATLEKGLLLLLPWMALPCMETPCLLLPHQQLCRRQLALQSPLMLYLPLLCLEVLSSPLVHAWLRLSMLLRHQAWLLLRSKALLGLAMVVLLYRAWLLLHAMA